MGTGSRALGIPGSWGRSSGDAAWHPEEGPEGWNVRWPQVDLSGLCLGCAASEPEAVQVQVPEGVARQLGAPAGLRGARGRTPPGAGQH